MHGLLAWLKAQHAGISPPNRDLFCIAVVSIWRVVFDLRQKMLNLLCPKQRFKPNPTCGHRALSHQGCLSDLAELQQEINKKALRCYQLVTVLSHPAAGPQQGTS